MAGPAKIGLIERLGADLKVVPGAYANALEAAREYEAETGAMQIHAYDAPATVAGQGTCMAEWEDQGLVADTVLIAVGGGILLLTADIIGRAIRYPFEIPAATVVAVFGAGVFLWLLHAAPARRHG